MSGHHHHHKAGPAHDHSDLADLLALDADVLGGYLDEVTEWVSQVSASPRTIVDVGAGTGAGTLALARRFRDAEIVAIDRSSSMLERVVAAAREGGVLDRVRVVEADLETGWPSVSPVDVVWLSSVLHEFADPDRLLGEVLAALTPGGLLVVIEMDTLPRFLPDDVGLGRPGLEERCHQALARAGWNAHPDWRPHLERAGFETVEQRSFTSSARPGPDVGRYGRAYLSRIRPALEDKVDAEDLEVLDRVLAGEDPSAVLDRADLAVRGCRTVWVARRAA